eukprot:6068503-Prymnesium_polylepis.1
MRRAIRASVRTSEPKAKPWMASVTALTSKSIRPSGGSQCMTPLGSEVARSSPGRSEPRRLRVPCGGVRRIRPQNQRRTAERTRRESRAVCG